MTVQLFNSILTLSNALISQKYIKEPFYNLPIYSNMFVVKYNKYNTNFRNAIEYHNIKCWKSNCIFNIHLENNIEENSIFSLDFNINKNDISNPFIKIDYMNTNNDFYDKKYNECYKNNNIILNDDENILIKNSLMKLIENFGIKENINKIIIDIHITPTEKKN